MCTFATKSGRTWFAALLPTLLLLPNCNAKEKAEREEATRVSQAIDALRNSEKKDKRKHLETLRATDCKEQAVCAVQKTCVEAYALHVGALETIRQGLVKVNDGSMDQAETTLAAGRADLERSEQLAEDCKKVEAEMRQRLKL